MNPGVAGHIGVELSPRAVRLVEIDGSTEHRDVPTTRVRAFAVLPREGGETRATLRAVRGRRVAVVAWGLQGEHRQVVVNRGARERMAAEGLIVLRDAGVGLDHMLADVAPVGPEADRQTVLLAAARADAILSALRPLTAAGVRPHSVVTPALALAALSRARQSMTPPHAAEAYVALEESATCLALVRDGALFAAREIPWGFEDPWLPSGEPARREAIAARLREELLSFLAVTCAGPIAQVCLCGAPPDLRTTAMALMERLDLEVEPLDSLFAIEPRGSAFVHMPGSRGAPDEFRERSAELRLSWAAAAEWPAPLNLIGGSGPRPARPWLPRMAAAAAAAGALGVMWWAMARTQAAGPQSSAPPPVMPLTSLSETMPAPGSLRSPASAPVGPAPKPVSKRETALPFDATLNTILYAPERKVAIVDGRIVQVGDAIRGAYIVEIAPTAVLLRDRQGRLRRLDLGRIK